MAKFEKITKEQLEENKAVVEEIDDKVLEEELTGTGIGIDEYKKANAQTGEDLEDD